MAQKHERELASVAKFQNISFRPRVEMVDDYEALIKWCRENNSTFNSVINSLIPAIAYAVANHIYTDEDDERYILCDFGHIKLVETGPYQRNQK